MGSAPISTNHIAPYRDEHLVMDFEQQAATLDNARIALTRKEYDLLALLVRHAGEIIRLRHRQRRLRQRRVVVLIDVSGSMTSDDKLPLLKKGLSLLVKELTEDDRVTIITYAGDAGEKLPTTNGTDKQKILQAIEALHSGGSTNGSAGIHLAYEKAKEHFIPGGTNRVLWATDGDLNVGVTGDAELVENLVGSDPQLCAVGERPLQIFDLHRNAIRIFTVNRRIVELCGVFEQDVSCTLAISA